MPPGARPLRRAHERRTPTRPDADGHADAETQPEAHDGADNVLNRAALSLAGHALPPRKATAKTLAQFVQLRRLDLSDMKPSDEAPEGLTDLRMLTQAASLSKKHAKKTQATPLTQRLTWLNLSNNAALGRDDDALVGIELLTALNVLNASHCALRSFPAGLAALEQLKALVFSHNHITQLPPVFPHLVELNTLVLSHNELTHLPKTLPASLPNLKKLSLSHNQLVDGETLPDFSVCAHLREVRLSGNTSLARLPEHIQRWGRGVDGGAPGLVLLDVGDCGLADWTSIAPLLAHSDSRHKGLVNLCLKGNGVATLEDYDERVRAACPSLLVLDNVRLRPKKTEKPAEAPRAPSPAPDEAGAAPEPPAPAPQESAPRSKGKRASRNEGHTGDAPKSAPVSRKRQREESGSHEDGPARPEPQPEGREKKTRKRSGRGPKKPKAAESAQARLLARAGPAPGDVEDLDDEPSVSRYDGASDEDARLRARAGPPPEEDASAAPAASGRTKKTRRKKSHRPVELTMDMSAESAAAPETPAAPAPPSPPAPKDTAADTGVVDIVQVRKPPRSAPLNLGRREEDLGGW
ncbi:hypothetical protein MBRA1_003860 [Malassezia brasiliensis]|uniref:Uncharacterized protein n=1 Tax=Malassezia brasiliensis TaxID=1821822 RepID=A0AAF0E0B3_9BASI|nr:hypothetical protein MBRA1_003860 [Malassezia brasiliensis]